jgi:TonB family protein
MEAFFALGALSLGGTATAEWRCDCTEIVGSCAAAATVRDSFIEVTSDVEQCARVDYFVDGRPFVALVVDGSAREDWIAQGESPTVLVQSCQVCVDNSGTTAADTGFGEGLYREGEPVPIVSVDPVYPPAAAAAGVEGFVELRFSVSPTGTVIDPEVVASEPPGVFDEAALAAVDRWRYTRPPLGEEQSVEVTERLDFDLSEEILSLTARDNRNTGPVAATNPARNDCVREDTRYNFGSAIDISLLNACEQPLLVYHCAAGTGSYRDRWVCRDPQGATLDATGRLEITRAPNSEYWWLACAVDDAGCIANGRDWIRSLDRQTASLDPQARSRARLARSY